MLLLMDVGGAALRFALCLVFTHEDNSYTLVDRVGSETVELSVLACDRCGRIR